MISKIYYSIVAFLIIVTLVACELFEEGYGDKVDLSDPVLTFDSPESGSYENSQFTLKGTVSDDTGISSVIIEFESDVSGETVIVTESAEVEDGNWYLDINSDNTTIFEDGEVDFTVTVTDTSDKTSSKSRMLYIDNTIPTVIVSSPSSDDLDIINGDLTISGEVEDLKLDRVEVYVVSTTDSSVKYGGTAIGTSSWSYDIDTIAQGLGTDNVETYYIDVTAYDTAGNSNSYFYFNDDLSSIQESLGLDTISMDDLTDESNDTILSSYQKSSASSSQLTMYVDQNYDTPNFLNFDEWGINDPDNYTVCDENGLTIKGDIEDDDGLESVILSIYNSDDELIRQGTVYPSSSTSYNMEVSFEAESWTGYTMTSNLTAGNLAEGIYSFSITANDIEGLTTGTATIPNPANFAFDDTAPTIDITSPIANDSFHSDFTLIGTVDDEVNVESVSIEVGDNTAVLATLSDDKSTWRYDVDVTDIEGDVTITATASDGNGHTEYDTVKVYVDATLPVIDPTLISYPSDVNGTITVTGKATDNLLDYVTYNVGGVTGTATLDGTSWAFDFDTTAFYTDDPTDTVDLSFNVWAFDESGNQSVDLSSTYNIFTVEESSDDPIITFKQPDEDNNSFAGTVAVIVEITDDDGVDTSSIDLKINGISYTGSYTGTEIITYKYSTNDLDDGSYSMSLGVDDINGVATIQDIDFIVDSKGPTVSVISPTSSLTYKNSLFTITGTAIDTIGYVDSLTVTAVYDSGDEEEYNYFYDTDDGISDFTIDSSGNWSIDITTVSVTTGNDDTLTLSISALDNAGNESGVITRNLVIDKSDPVESTDLTSSSTDLNGTVKLSGSISDDNLDYAEIYIVDTDFNTWMTITDTPYSWSYTLDTAKLTDNSYTVIYVRGVDKAGNNAQSEYTLSVDQTADKPVISMDSITNYTTTTTISGTVLDDDGINSEDIVVTLLDSTNTVVKTITNASGNSSTSVDWSVNLADTEDGRDTIEEGLYTLIITGTDSTTYKLGDSSVSNDESVSIVVDNGPPTLDESGSTSNTYTVNNTLVIDDVDSTFDSEKDYFAYSKSKDISLYGTADDGNAIESFTVTSYKDSVYSNEYTIVDSENVSFVYNEADGKYDWTFVLTVADDAQYEFIIKVVDPSEEFTEISREIMVDTTSPNLVVTNPVSNEIVDSNSYPVSGTIYDNGGKGISSLQYSRNNSDWINIVVSGLSWDVDVDFSTTVGSESAEGSRTLYIRATDGINTYSTESINFSYDTAYPVLSENLIGSATQIIRNSAVSFGGTVSDSNALSSTDPLVVSVNGSSESITVDDDGNWSYTLDCDSSGSDDGSYVLEFTATDAAGRETELERNIMLDATAPVTPVISSSPGEYVEDSYAVSGTAEDTTSGIAKVEYSLDSSTWVSVNGTDNWSKTVDISALGQGDNRLYIQSTDKAGNISLTSTQIFDRDTSAPTLTETGIGTESQRIDKDAVTFSGSVDDSNALSSFVVTVNETDIDLTDQIDGADNDITLTEDNSTTWSYTVPNTTEGSFTLVFKATDAVSRTTTVSRSVLIDTTAPESLAITPTFSTYEETSINIEGTASDSSSGLSKVEYSFDNSTWSTASDTDSWSKSSINISSLTDGDKTLYVRATDNAGNTTTTSQGFVKDNEDPELTVTGYDSTTYKGAAFTVSGNISDNLTLGSTPVTVSVTKDGTDVTLIESVDYGTGTTSKTWSQEVPVSDGEGTYVVTINAADAVGRLDGPIVTSDIIVDTQAPTVAISNLNDNDLISETSYTVNGSASENGAAGLSSVEYSLDGGDWTEFTSQDTWTLSLTGLTDNLSTTLEIRATDKAGNVTVSTAERTFKVSTATPVTTISGVDTSFEYVNAAPSISGTASDGNGITSVSAAYKLDNGVSTSLTVSGTTSWEITDFPSTEGVYDLTITVLDGASETSEYSRSVAIDSTAPELEVTSPTSGGYVESNSYTIRGTVSDGTGQGVSSLEYSRDNSSWTSISVTGLSWNVSEVNFSTQIGEEDVEGDRTLYVRATDGLNGYTTDTITFNYDTTAPTITETTITDDSETIKSVKPTFTGSVSDANAMSSFKVSVNGTEEDLTDLIDGDDDDIATIADNSNDWSYELDEVDGSYEVIFTAEDIAGRTTTLTRNVILDTTTPTDPVISSSAGTYLSSSYTAYGFATDAISGIAKVDYSFDGTTYSTINGTSLWSETLDISGLNEGENTLYIKSTDLAGHESNVVPQTFYIDSAVPTLTETGTGTESQQIDKDAVTFSGSVDDSNALSSLVVTVNGADVDLTDQIDGADNDITLTADNSTTWSYTVPNTTEGTYTLVFTATDAVNRTTTVSRSVLIDTTAPESLVITPTFSTYEETSINIEGTASDSSSGLSKVEYSFDNSTWSTASNTTSWSKSSVNISSLTDGDKTLYVRATDNAGNTKTTTQGFVKDNEDPELTVTGYDSTSYKGAAFTVSGNISDNLTLGSTPVTVSVKKDGSTVTLIESVDYGTGTTSKTWSQEVPVSDGEGTYVVTVNAADAVGRLDGPIVTANIIVDTQAPSLTVDNFVDSQLISGTSYNIEGTATESGDSGIDNVEYSIDSGANWIEATTTDSWANWEVGLTGLTDSLSHEYKVRVTDKAGNVDDSTAISFKVSTAEPETTITGVDTTFQYVSDSVLGISGTATDGNGIQLVSGSYSIDGGTSVALTITGTDSWLTTLPSDNGVYDITITVTDKATETTSYSRSVAIDTNAPDLTVTSPSADENVTDSNYTIRGTVTDNSGTGVTLLQFSTDEKAYTNADKVWTDITVAYSWSQTYDFTGTDGTRTLDIRASDGLNGYTYQSVNFYHDDTIPEISEITINTDDQQYKNLSFTMDGTALDLVEFDKIVITSTKDGVDTGIEDEFSTYDSGNDNYPFSKTVTLSSDGSSDGEWEYTITAYDEAGNTNTIDRSIFIDETAPDTPVLSTTLSNYYDTTMSISGTASDASSGVVKVEYSLDNSNWTALTGADNWLGTISISGQSAGTNYLYLRSTDSAGNVSAVNTGDVSDSDYSKIEYTIDKDNPESGVNGTWGDSEYKDDDFDLSGTATDVNGIASVEVTGDGITDYLINSASWNTTITPTIQGINTIDITITDGVGKESKESITFFYDNVAPEVSVTSFDTSTLVSTTSYTILGSASDTGGSGVKSVEYRHSDDGGSTWETGWTSASGTGTWAAQLADLEDSENHKLEVRATDNSDKTCTVESYTFTVDTNVPLIGDLTSDRATPFDFATDDNTTIVTTNQAYGGNSSEFALRVLAKDTIGIDTVQIEIEGTNYSFSEVIDEEDADEDGDFTDVLLDSGYEVWESNVNIDISAVSDGTKEWIVTVTDDSGLESTLTKTVLIDNSVPTITYTYPGNLDDIVNGEVEVKGLGEDEGSGLSTVQYKVGYTPENEDWKNVDGSTFSWEIPFTNEGIGKIDNYGGLEVDSVDNDSNTITMSNHGYTEDTPVWVGDDDSSSTSVYGLSNTTTYYIIYVDDDTFQLSTTTTGTVVTLTSDTEILRISKYAKDSDGDTIWELPIIIKADDAAGNEYLGYNSTDETFDYIVYADPSGDKPNVSIVYPDPDDTNRIMGGIIRVFGTATDDDGVEAVYMQIDTGDDGTEDYVPTYDSADVVNGTNWYISGTETIDEITYDILGQEVDGSASWNMSINTNGEFDSETEGERNTVYFRVRVKDINGTYGPWTESQTIIFDNDVPTIGSSVSATLVNDEATEQAYVADMWISGSWNLNCSIEDASNISRIVITSDDIDDLNIDLSGDTAISEYEYVDEDDEGWFETYSTTDTSGYLMSLPIDTTDSGLSGNSISITVTAYDASTDESSSSTTFAINFDNTAPTMDSYEGSTPIEQSNNSYELKSSVTEDGSGLERVAFYFLRDGTDSDRVYNPLERGYDTENKIYFTTTDTQRLTDISTLSMVDGLPRFEVTDSSRTDEYSLTDSDIITNYNVRVGGLIKIGGLDRIITEVNYSTGKVTWDEAVDTDKTTGYIAYAMVVDNFTIETPSWSNNYMTKITNDDGDFMVEAIERSGGLYDWSASIDSLNIPDGPIEIHWVAYDESGNYDSMSVETEILNNRPKLAKVTLGTDLDGNGTVVGAGNDGIADYTDYVYEIETVYSLSDDDNGVAIAVADSSSFIAKDTTTIDLEVVGGNGELQYEIGTGYTETDDVYSINNEVIGLTQLRATDGDTATISTIELDVDTNGKLEGVSDSESGTYDTFYIKVWDSTEETIIGSTSQWAFLTLPMVIDVTDGVVPTASVSPFYWNSESDNSLLGNSSGYGHIDFEDDGDDGTDDRDGTNPDISGQISIRGTAFDDQRITQLFMLIDEMEMTGIDGTDEDEVVDTYTDSDEVYQMVAYYDSGSWTVADKWSTEGWEFAITSNSIGQTGHTVDWQLDWDTSKLASYSSVDETWTTIVAGNNKNIKVVAIDKSNINNSLASINDLYTVDVVPYITEINRNSSFTTYRAQSGAYPLLRGEEDNTINGFNLTTGGTLAIKNSLGTTTSSMDYAMTDGTIYFDMPTTVKSGWLELSINSVQTINNTNSNSNDYNSESVDNVDETDYWYDDRYIRVWESDSDGIFKDSDVPVYPAMSMDDDGTLYASYSNYSTASVYYSTLISQKEVFYTYDPSEETDIVATGTGEINVLYNANYHGGNSYQWDDPSPYAGGLYVYDDDASSDYYGRTNETAHRLELFYHDEMLQQFKNIRVARGSNSIIHSSYYDRITGSIHYSAVAEDNNPDRYYSNSYREYLTDHENPWVNIDGGSDTDDTATYSEGTSIALDDTVFENGITRTSATDEYSAIAIDEDNLPVVIYLDAEAGILRLARSSNISPYTATNWAVQTIMSSTDENYGKASDYFSAKIDSTGVLHIIFRNNSSQLCYIKSTNNPESGAAYTFDKSETIDDYGLWADLTIKGTIPYISYMSKVNAYDGIKMAYYDSDLDLNGDGTAEGGWETMTAAMAYKSSSVRTSIEALPDTDSNGDDITQSWTAAIGYTPSDYYRVVYYIDE